jgi:hypothetical protein
VRIINCLIQYTLIFSLLPTVAFAGDGTFNGGGGGDSARLEKSGQFTFAALELIRYLKAQNLTEYPQINLSQLEMSVKDEQLQVYSTEDQLYAQENGERRPVDALTFKSEKKIVYNTSIFTGGNAIRSRTVILHELFRLAGIFDDGAAASRLFLPVIVKDFVKANVVFNFDGSISYVGDPVNSNVPIGIKMSGRWLSIDQIIDVGNGDSEGRNSAEAFCASMGLVLVGARNTAEIPGDGLPTVDLSYSPPRLGYVHNPDSKEKVLGDITCRWPTKDDLSARRFYVDKADLFVSEAYFDDTERVTVALKDGGAAVAACHGASHRASWITYYYYQSSKDDHSEKVALSYFPTLGCDDRLRQIMDLVNSGKAKTLRFSPAYGFGLGQ